MHPLRTLLLSAVLALTAGSATAQAPYPNQPVRLLVPYAAGGAADVVARAVAERAATLLGQPIVIENRLGGGGSVAAEAVARAAPDGYTVLLTSVAIPAINPHLAKLNFDPVNDLSTVAVVATGYTALVVATNSPYKTAQQLIAAGREKGRDAAGKLSFGTSGNASITHLTAEMFTRAAGFEALHVPYKGNPQVLADLVGGRLDFTFDGVWKANVANGHVRALAYTGPRRHPAMPDVPTVAEVLPNYTGFEPWIGFAVSARTPDAIQTRLGDALIAAGTHADVTRRLDAAGMELRNLGRKDMTPMIARDHKALGELIRQRGIQP